MLFFRSIAQGSCVILVFRLKKEEIMNYMLKDRRITLLCFFFVLSINVGAQTFVEIGDLQIALGTQTYSAPTKNKSITGEVLSVSGQQYRKGIGVHPHSIIKIELNGGKKFTAEVGINDSKIDYSSEKVKSIPLTDGKRIFYHVTDTKKQFVGVEGKDGKVDEGSVIFKLLHNGTEIYTSGIIRKGDKAKEINVEVKGGILEMVVEDAGDNASGDHAVWVDPKIEYFEVPPVIVASDFQGEVPKQSEEISSKLATLIQQLPEIQLPLKQPEYDWLIDNEKAKANVYRSKSGKDIVLSNGLIARVFRLMPNLATVDYVNQMTGESILRSVSNEGVLTIDGKMYTIGGLSGQPEYAYTLLKWVDDMPASPNSFHIENFEVKELSDRLEWKRVRWASNDKMPTGKELIFTLSKESVVVKVHYALYDGIPTLSKWIEVINNNPLLIQLNAFKLEQLAMVEGENLVDVPEHFVKPNIHIETDYAFGGMQQKTSDKTTYWETDPRYTSQTNYTMQLPCMLEVKPPLGPDTGIPSGQTLTTFRVWETPFDSFDKERKGLFLRNMYRTISPWTTENPIFLHLTSTDPEEIKAAVDQCAAVGYEMIILSFGSDLNMENESQDYYNKFKSLVDYAKSKGIELGGYSLLSSRWISDEVDVINPETGKRGGMIFGSSPCLSSEWGYDCLLYT